MTRSFRLACLSSCAAVAAFVAPAAALAQADGAAQLTEVVVTAQKREQRLQDVPVSVTALPAETLVANRITTVRDLDAVVPNMTVRTIVGGASLPNYTIRGLVSLGSALGADKGVALYIDGVYQGAAYGSMFQLADLQSVEVLRGPQGTLFGRNSTGGAVSLTTPNPSGQFGVKQRFTVGNYDQFRSSTTVNLPEFANISASVSYTHDQRRGDVRNLGAGTTWNFGPSFGGKPKTFTAGKWLGSENVDSVGAKVRYNPNDKLDIIYRFDWSDEHQTAPASGVIYASPTILGIVASQPNQALMTRLSSKRPKAVNNAAMTPSHIVNWGHAITVQYRISDAVTLKNVAAVRFAKFTSPWQDFGGYGGLINTGAPGFAALLGPALAASTVGAPFLIQSTNTGGKEKQWSDELQLNIDTKLVTLTSGLLYYEQRSDRQQVGADSGLGRARSVTFSIYPGYLVPFAGQPQGAMGRASWVQAYSRAAYAQGEFHVTPQLDLVAGARYTADRKKGVDNGIASGNPLTSRTFVVDYSDSRWTYNAGVNYKVTPDLLVYGKYGTGYISGGVVSSIAFDVETAKSWEAGLKGDWLNRTLRTNLAVFDVKYDGIQVPISGRSLVPARPEISQALISAGDARAKGFEFEGTWLPIRPVMLSAGVGLTDFKYTRLDPRITNGIVEYLVANRPKWTVALSGQYTTDPLFDDVKLVARIDGNWKSKSNATSTVFGPTVLAPDQVPIYKAAQVIDAYWLVNARLALQGFKVAGADAELALWGRNIFNNKSVSYSASLGSLIPATYESARTVGLDLLVEF